MTGPITAASRICGTARMPVWLRLFPASTRGAWFPAAVALTLLWILARTLAPAPGLTRSYYLLDRSIPPAIDDRTPPVVEHAMAVDLEFIDERGRPTRYYLVRWEGIWWSPRPERIDFHAAADDSVAVRVDGELVVERNPAIGMTGTPGAVQLDAGAHRIEIVHRQHGGGRILHLQWAPVGGEPRPIGPIRTFPSDPGAAGYWLAVASAQLPALVLLTWAAGPVVALVGRYAKSLRALGASELRERLGVILFPALLGPSQLLLFGPWTVHATNRAEFLVSFWRLAPTWSWLLAPIAGVLAALGIVLPARWFSRYVAVLWGAGLLLWMQGNLLLADYGALDGRGLDLASHAGRAPFELALWLGVVALAVVFAESVKKAAPTASVLLMALQAAFLLPQSVAPATAAAADDEWRLPPPAIYELSSTRNVIHIVLDMFSSHVFADLLNGDRPAFDRDWSGFIYYPDHLGAMRRTEGSIPAMLTGVAFRNNVPFTRYLAGHPSIFHALGAHGYRLRSLAGVRIGHPDSRQPGVERAIRYTIPAPYAGYHDYLDAAAVQLLDLSLFRHTPHGLKAHVYRDRQWFLQAWLARRQSEAGNPAELPFSSVAFLSDFTERAVVDGDAPVYTFLHLITPHPPIVTDANCAYTGGSQAITRDGYIEQARCALAAVGALLDRLRDLDLYDRSAIVVTSDHGWDTFAPDDHPLRGIDTPAGRLDMIATDASPLLLIKPVGSRGSLDVSNAPTATTDVPATLLHLAGLRNTLERGTSALELDPTAIRARTYAHYDPPGTWRRPYHDVLHVFSVRGRANSPAAWRLQEAIFEPGDDRASQLRRHRVGLDAIDVEDAGPPGRRVYRTGDYAAFYVAPGARRIAFDLRAPAGDTRRADVTVTVDGRVAGRHRIAADEWSSLDIPVEARSENDNPFCVELVVNSLSRGADADQGTGVLVRGDF